MSNDLIEAIKALRETLLSLPQSLAATFGAHQASSGPGPNTKTGWATHAAASFAGSLGRHATVGIAGHSVSQLIGSALRQGVIKAVASLQQQAPAVPRMPPLARLATHALPLLQGLAKGAQGVLPPGMNLQGVLTRQITSNATQLIQGALGKAFSAVTSKAGYNVLSPQVANSLGTKIGQLQTFIAGRNFQTNFAVTIGQTVAKGLARIQAGGSGPGIGGAAAAGRGLLGLGAGASTALVVAGVVGGLVALGVAAKVAVDRMGRFAEEVNDSNRRLAPWNATIAQAFQQLNLGDMSRSLRLGAATQDTAAQLARSLDAMREANFIGEAVLGNLRNRAAAFGADVNAAGGELGGRLLLGIQNVLNAVGLGGNNKDFDPGAWVKRQAHALANALGLPEPPKVQPQLDPWAQFILQAQNLGPIRPAKLFKP